MAFVLISCFAGIIYILCTPGSQESGLTVILFLFLILTSAFSVIFYYQLNAMQNEILKLREKLIEKNVIDKKDFVTENSDFNTNK